MIKKMLIMLLLSFFLLLNLYAQNLNIIQSSLDSVRSEKSILLEKIEALELLEAEYSKLANEVLLNSVEGEIFSIIAGTALYKEPARNTVITNLNRGDKVKLLKREEFYCHVSVNGYDGYIYTSVLSDESIPEISKISNEDTYASAGGNSVQCKGIAKSTGQRCRNKTKNENGYCYLHQSQAEGSDGQIQVERLTTSVQCRGATKSGTRCKNKTLNANGYCHLHQSQVVAIGNMVKTPTATPARNSSSNRVIHTGPRGGKYYINSSGKKVYVK